jgi:hypothetical protein
MHFFGIPGAFLLLIGAALLPFWTVPLAMAPAGAGLPPKVFPFLLLDVLALFVGVMFVLTGIVCDFLLHHMMRTHIDDWINQNVKEVTDQSEKLSPEPWQEAMETVRSDRF